MEIVYLPQGAHKVQTAHNRSWGYPWEQMSEFPAAPILKAPWGKYKIDDFFGQGWGNLKKSCAASSLHNST